MQRIKRGAALLMTFGVLAGLGSGCGNNGGSGGVSGNDTPLVNLNGKDSVATVNGQTISQSQFFTQLQNYAPNPQNPQPVTAGRAILQQLIQNALVVALAKKEGVAPTDAEVDAQFQNIATLQNAKNTKPFEDILKDVGLTASDVKSNQILPQLAQLKILTKGVKITDTEIKAYYDLNKGKDFTKPNRAHIKVIVVANQADAKDIYDSIQKGQTFESQISRSIDTRFPEGDLPQWVPIDDGQNPTLAPLVKAVKSTAVGAVSAPYAFDRNWWVVKVVEKKDKEVLPLDQVKGLIQLTLLNQKSQQNPQAQQKFEQDLRDFDKAADVAVSLPGQQYADMVKAIKNPPQVSPNLGGGGGAPSPTMPTGPATPAAPATPTTP